MSVHLLDVNVLIALAWPTHVHHDLAHEWFKRHAKQGWATCPLTQCAFVRISANPRIIPDAATVADCLKILASFVAHGNHNFWTDNIELTAPVFPAKYLIGHRQVTDAYLLALAQKRKGRLATFDQGIRAILPKKLSDRYIVTIE